MLDCGFKSSKPAQAFIINNLSLKKESNKDIFHQLNLKFSRIESNDFVAIIKDGESIEYNFLGDINCHKKQVRILHQALPSLLFQRESFVLHGSAFEYNGRAIIIMGSSGSGKSESINIIQKQNKIISDDILAIGNLQNTQFCYPGLSALCIKKTDSKRPLNDKRKRSIEIITRKNMTKEKLTISDIFFLHWGGENKILGVDSVNSLKQIISNSFRPIPSGDCKKSEEFYLSSAINLISNSNQYNFYRKRGDVNHSIQYLYNFLKKKYD